MTTFRPQRRVTRLSLSAVPSTADENGATAMADNKKKRSQSLGGEALSELLGLQDLKKKLSNETLSPRKRARRSLVPGRSILKARPLQTDDTDNLDFTGTHTFTHNLTQSGSANLLAVPSRPEDVAAEGADKEEKDTTAATPGGVIPDGAADDDDDEDEEDDDDMSMEITEAIGGIKSRKSLMASASRRVSFAPKAHVRVFDSERDGDGNPIASPASSRSPSKSPARRQAEPSSPSPAATADGQAGASMDFSNPTGSASRRGSTHRRAPSITSLPGEESNDTPPLPLGLPPSVSVPDHQQGHAAHLAWLRANPAQAADLEEEEQSLSMEMAADEITSAFGGQQFRNAPAQEDDEDDADEGSMAMDEATEEVTRAFGQSTHLLRGMAGVGGSNGLGALGFGLKKQASFDALNVGDEDQTGDMDLTMQHDRSMSAVVPSFGPTILFDGKTSRRISESGFARRASVAPALAGALVQQTNEDDDDVDMEDATGFLDRSAAGVSFGTPSRAANASIAVPKSPIFSPTKSVLNQTANFGTPPPGSPFKRRRSASPSKRGVHMPSPRRIDVPPPPPILLPSPRRVPVELAQAPKLEAPPTPRSAATPDRLRVPVSASGYAAPSSLAKPRDEVLERKLLGGASPVKVGLRSPAQASPAVRKVVRIEEDEESEMSSFRGDESIDRVPAKMTIDDFLGATNIQFMEDVFGATKRQSMAMLGRRSEDDDETANIKKPTLATHVHAASARVPLLELLHTAAQELKYGLQENQEFLDRLEGEVQTAPPVLFKEWFNATDDQRSIMETQFKMLKTHFTLAVRNEWYDYKSAMMASLKDHMEKSVELLRRDFDVLMETRASLETALPDLESRHAELLAEVEKERARRAELDSDDKEHLNTLKEAIREQGAVLEDFKTENQEVQAQLARLNDKYDEAETQKAEHVVAIAQGRATCEQLRCFTKNEVFRLRDELNALQELNGWDLTSFQGADVQLSFCNEVSVTLGLQAQRVRSVGLRLLPVADPKASQDVVRSGITEYLFSRMNAEVSESSADEAKNVLRRIARMWTLARRLRHELLLARTRFPMAVVAQRPDQPFRVLARVNARPAKAAFDVLFEVSGEEIVDSLIENVTDGVGAIVKPAFGNVDCDELTYVVRDRISRGERGGLLQACELAQQSAEDRSAA